MRPTQTRHQMVAACRRKRRLPLRVTLRDLRPLPADGDASERMRALLSVIFLGLVLGYDQGQWIRRGLPRPTFRAGTTDWRPSVVLCTPATTRVPVLDRRRMLRTLGCARRCYSVSGANAAVENAFAVIDDLRPHVKRPDADVGPGAAAAIIDCPSVWMHMHEWLTFVD